MIRYSGLTHYLLVTAILIGMLGCQSDDKHSPEQLSDQQLIADAVFFNAAAYTQDDDKPWVQALAIKNGRFIAVGSEGEIRPYIGLTTQVNDLDGRMVMPGIHDAHTHLLNASLKFGNYYCDLPYPEATDGQLIAALKDCNTSDRPKRGDWLVAGIVGEDKLNSRAFIDLLNQEMPNTPVLIKDYTNHNAVVNQIALEIAGIDKNTPDPHGGKLLRDSDGVPTGALFETAARLVYRAIPPFDEAVNLEAIRWAVQQNHRYGITSVQEASAIPANLRVFKQLDEAGELQLHVAAHLIVDNEKFADNQAMEQAIKNRTDYATEHVDTNFAKLWLDGAPSDIHPTFSSVDPETGQIDEEFMLFKLADLPAIVGDLDRQGISVKMHAAGDGAARAAIDTVAAIRKTNKGQLYHEIGHSASIHADDFERIAPLNLIAELSPAVWHLFPGYAGWPFNTLHQSGVLVTVGTDWLVEREPNLFPPLQGMLQHGEESVDLATALEMLTINGAKAVGKADQIGSISVGKSADFIVLDQNLFEIPVDRIKDTRVIMTVFEGDTVYIAQ